MRSFDTLSEQEVLALAISLEEEDERIYADYAEGLCEKYTSTAKVFEGMREEESATGGGCLTSTAGSSVSIFR